MILRWLLYFIPALAIELYCYLTAPVVALFIVRSLELDTVKRLDRQSVWLMRDNLVPWLYWHQTHDNNCDEWWYGRYNDEHWFSFARAWTQADYDASRLIRYYCRVMWLWRNSAYGFHYALFSRPLELANRVYTKGIEGAGYWHQLEIYPSSFKLEAQVPHNPLRVIAALIILVYVAFCDPTALGVFSLAAFYYAFYQLIKGRYLTINIGWKSHKGKPLLLYANRIIGFRKY